MEKKIENNDLYVRDEKDDLPFQYTNEFDPNSPNFIYLFNDEYDEFDEKQFKKYQERMKNRFYTYAKCCFINIKDSYTYEPFLNSLSELTLQEQKLFKVLAIISIFYHLH